MADIGSFGPSSKPSVPIAHRADESNGSLTEKRSVLARACNQCKKHKMRCEYNDLNDEAAGCKRCLHTGKVCEPALKPGSAAITGGTVWASDIDNRVNALEAELAQMRRDMRVIRGVNNDNEDMVSPGPKELNGELYTPSSGSRKKRRLDTQIHVGASDDPKSLRTLTESQRKIGAVFAVLRNLDVSDSEESWVDAVEMLWNNFHHAVLPNVSYLSGPIDPNAISPLLIIAILFVSASRANTSTGVFLFFVERSMARLLSIAGPAKIDIDDIAAITLLAQDRLGHAPNLDLLLALGQRLIVGRKGPSTGPDTDRCAVLWGELQAIDEQHSLLHLTPPQMTFALPSPTFPYAIAAKYLQNRSVEDALTVIASRALRHLSGRGLRTPLDFLATENGATVAGHMGVWEQADAERMADWLEDIGRLRMKHGELSAALDFRCRCYRLYCLQIIVLNSPASSRHREDALRAAKEVCAIASQSALDIRTNWEFIMIANAAKVSHQNPHIVQIAFAVLGILQQLAVNDCQRTICTALSTQFGAIDTNGDSHMSARSERNRSETLSHAVRPIDSPGDGAFDLPYSFANTAVLAPPAHSESSQYSAHVSSQATFSWPGHDMPHDILSPGQDNLVGKNVNIEALLAAASQSRQEPASHLASAQTSVFASDLGPQPQDLNTFAHGRDPMSLTNQTGWKMHDTTAIDPWPPTFLSWLGQNG